MELCSGCVGSPVYTLRDDVQPRVKEGTVGVLCENVGNAWVATAPRDFLQGIVRQICDLGIAIQR